MTMARQPGRRVRIKGNVSLWVEEFDHAYLVRGPGIMYGPTAQQGRLALFEFLGRKKWTRIAGMPYRPLYTGEFGDKNPCGAIAFYFSVARGGDRKYKP